MTTPAATDASAVLDLINAGWITQAVGVAAALGVADQLASEPSDAPALASRLGCDESSLARLLDALVGLGLCARDSSGRYAVSARGELLRSDARPSLRAWAIYNALHAWQAWGGLIDSVRTGISARELQGEGAGYERLARPDRAAVFHAAMEELTALVAGHVACDPVFEGLTKVVDVGGGHGQLLIAVLRAYPRLHGAVFDLPHAEPGARAAFEASGVSDRANFHCGDFLKSVPGPVDSYIIKSVLHNWRDEDVLRLLGACREASPRASLVIVERMLPPAGATDRGDALNYRSDLGMMVGLGGRERTRREIEALLDQRGYAVKRCRSLGFGFSLLQAACLRS